jgi:hypothetical protein
VEFRGARGLRRLDPAAAGSLGCNQLFLGAVLLVYAAFSLWNVYHGPNYILDQLRGSPELSMLGPIEQLAHLVGLLIYGTLAAVAIFGQGGTAWYYVSRRKHIETYLRDTPPWIVDAQRAGMPM